MNCLLDTFFACESIITLFFVTFHRWMIPLLQSKSYSRLHLQKEWSWILVQVDLPELFKIWRVSEPFLYMHGMWTAIVECLCWKNTWTVSPFRKPWKWFYLSFSFVFFCWFPSLLYSFVVFVFSFSFYYRVMYYWQPMTRNASGFPCIPKLA